MFLMSGQQVHNILWFEREAPWTEEERSDLNDAISTWWEAQKSNWSSSIALAQITTVNQDTFNAPATTLIIAPISAGTGAGNGPANNVALVATLRTDFRGRNFRGRMFIAGHRAADIQDTLQATGAHVTSLLAALAALKVAIDALGAIWVVVSKYINKVPRAAGLTTNITAISMDPYWDSQRRRLFGRGV
jgi:hypothetical protein